MSFIKWKVMNWYEEPSRYEFKKETKQFYVKANGSREIKISSFYKFFDTEQEAMAFIELQKKEKEEQKKLDRIRNTASELLEALQACVKQITALCSADDVPDQARAAIAKATGQ